MCAPTNPAARNLTSRRVGVGNKEMITQGLQIPIALMEDLGLVPSTHLAAHTICHFSSRDPIFFAQKSKMSIRHTCGGQTYMKANHSQNEMNKPKSNLGKNLGCGWSGVQLESPHP